MTWFTSTKWGWFHKSITLRAVVQYRRVLRWSNTASKGNLWMARPRTWSRSQLEITQRLRYHRDLKTLFSKHKKASANRRIQARDSIVLIAQLDNKFHRYLIRWTSLYRVCRKAKFWRNSNKHLFFRSLLVTGAKAVPITQIQMAFKKIFVISCWSWHKARRISYLKAQLVSCPFSSNKIFTIVFLKTSRWKS